MRIKRFAFIIILAIYFCLVWPLGPVWPATEDLTTYDEVDPQVKVTKTTSTVTWTGLDTNGAATYVQKDKTAGYFDGDFIHYFDFQQTTDGVYTFNSVWMVTNTVGNYRDTIDASGNALVVALYDDVSVAECIHVREWDGASQYISSNINITNGVPYYCTVVRDEAVGTYGEITLYVYDDAEKTSLVDSTSLTLHSKIDFQYINVCGNDDGWGNGDASTGWSANYDLAGEEEEEEVLKSPGMGFGGFLMF